MKMTRQQRVANQNRRFVDRVLVRQTINGHRVHVPADMKVTKEFGFPGAFDHIDYQGVMLTTFDELVDGCRFVLVDDPQWKFKDLGEFREYVDDLMARRRHDVDALDF